MNHNFIQQKYPGLVNGNKVSDTYYVCADCSIVKVVRESGRVDYLYFGNSSLIAGKLLKSEPACLKAINNDEPPKNDPRI